MFFVYLFVLLYVIFMSFVKMAAFVRTSFNKPYQYATIMIFHISQVAITHYISTSLFFSTDKVVPLQCACENVNDCVNNTCSGNYCYHTLHHEVEKKGCFQTFEQCHVPDVPGLYCNCCFTHFCNENSSLPKEGQ